MPIVLPEVSSLNLLKATRELAVLARLVRDEAGDLAYARLNRMQNAEHTFRKAFNQVAEDVQAGFAGAIVPFLNDRGMPGTAVQINTNAQALEAAWGPWQQAVLGVAQGLSGADLIRIKTTSAAGEPLHQMELNDFIPAADAAPLRVSAELSTVISAVEALGG